MKKLDDKLTSALEIITRKVPKNVKWCITGSCAGIFYGLNREPKDIDIKVKEPDVEKIANILREYMTISPRIMEKVYGNIRFKNLFAGFKINNYDIHIHSDVLVFNEERFKFFIDDGLLNRIRKVKICGTQIPIMSLEDYVILKAIYQREKDIGDLKTVLANNKIDEKYLEKRSKELKCYNRVFGLINKVIK